MKAIYVGLDVHKESISISALAAGAKNPRPCVKIPNDPAKLRRHIGRLAREGRVEACYEAGPCGYEVYRQLTSMRVACQVVAPSLIPKRPGDRVKTDRRDAEQLASLLRAEQLTPIRVPTQREQAARALTRCREDLRQDIGRERHRLLKFLLLRGRRYADGSHWTQRHWQWLRQQRFEDHADTVVYTEYLTRLESTLERRRQIDIEIDQLAKESEAAGAIARIRCLRGLDTVAAAAIHAEVCDFHRFDRAVQFASWTGLVPSEHSSGGKQQRGGITKAGNAHVRRLLVEAAWHYRHPPRRSKAMEARWEGQPKEVVEYAYKAQQRLHRRYMRLISRGKQPQVAAVAIARELACFIWGIATMSGKPTA